MGATEDSEASGERSVTREGARNTRVLDGSKLPKREKPPIGFLTTGSTSGSTDQVLVSAGVTTILSALDVSMDSDSRGDAAVSVELGVLVGGLRPDGTGLEPVRLSKGVVSILARALTSPASEALAAKSFEAIIEGAWASAACTGSG